MNRRSTSNDLDRIIGRAESLQRTLPAALNHIAAQINLVDGYTAGSDAPKVSSSSEWTPVERAGNKRLQLAANADYVRGLIQAAQTALDHAATECQTILGTRVETPRCSATGRDGAIEWADPNCWNVPARGPLCDACYQRERRWRIAHGMPTREDSAA